MDILFQKIPVKISNQPSPKEKRKSLLHDIGGGWFVDKLGQKLLTLKNSILGKKSQKKEDTTKRRLTEANQMWNDWKFQIHWSKLEWVNPRCHDERKNQFCVFFKKCYRDNVKPAHWVGHSKLKSFYTDDFFKRTPNFDGKHASDTGTTVKLSVSEETNNPVLL